MTSSQRGDSGRRRAIETQLKRTKELYVLGDFTRSQYDARKKALDTELASLEPPIVMDVSEAASALTNFTWFWERETDPAERNKVLRLIFEVVTVDDGQIVSVTPRDAFLPYFQFGQEGSEERERRDSNPRPPA